MPFLNTLRYDYAKYPPQNQVEGWIYHSLTTKIDSFANGSNLTTASSAITLVAPAANSTVTFNGVAALTGQTYSIAIAIPAVAPTAAVFATQVATAFGNNSVTATLFQASAVGAVVTLTSLLPGLAGNHTVVSSNGAVVTTLATEPAFIPAGRLLVTPNSVSAANARNVQVPVGLADFTANTIRGFSSYFEGQEQLNYSGNGGLFNSLRDIKVLRSGTIVLLPVTNIALGQTINIDTSVSGGARPTSAAVGGGVVALPSSVRLRLNAEPATANRLAVFDFDI